MNVYDTANKLAQEIKQSEEYIAFKVAKEAINLNFELKSKIDEFDKAKFEQIILHGPQFVYEKDEENTVIIKLTEKGKQLYIKKQHSGSSSFIECEKKGAAL